MWAAREAWDMGQTQHNIADTGGNLTPGQVCWDQYTNVKDGTAGFVVEAGPQLFTGSYRGTTSRALQRKAGASRDQHVTL
jgi:hypothetical protein